ncbi:MAG: hypothetical protein ACXVEF_27380 [Polyangiales bacterium]
MIRGELGLVAQFSPTKQMIVCDDDTRVVYTSRSIGGSNLFYDSIQFAPDSSFRVSPVLPPLRGRVVGCTVRTDNGDSGVRGTGCR